MRPHSGSPPWCYAMLCCAEAINRNRHCVIEAAHPSPLSVTKFRGCKSFSQANAFLKKKDREPIDWSLPR